MRVTNNMISSMVTRNLDRSLTKFMNLQGQMSTGKKLNTPSDDPVGAQKDLKYREVLSQISQFQSNIGSSLALAESYQSTLSEIQVLLANTYGETVDLANDDNDAASRAAAASLIENNFESLMSLGNKQINGRYIFSGFRTNDPAFMSGNTGVVFLGDQGRIDVEIEAASKVGVNLIGSDILLSELSILGEDANLDSGITVTTPLADLNLGAGIDLTAGTFEVVDNISGTSVTIDISTAVTVGDLIGLTNTQLALGGITTLGLDIGIENNNLAWTTVNTGQVFASTPLENLNNGGGVDLSSGSIRFHDSGMGISVDVDLSGTTTLGDVINEINTQLTAGGVNNVTASINAAGTGIDITDSNGVPLNLMISETSSESTLASDLGIRGDIDPVLNGGDLHPELDFSVTESGPGDLLASQFGLDGNFSMSKTGDALTPIIHGNTPLSQLNHGMGITLGQIQFSQGMRQEILDLDDPAIVTVDDLIGAINGLNLDINASINADQTGIQVRSTITTESLKIEDVGTGRVARDLGIFGSPDIMGSMQLLISALKNNDSEVIGELVGNLNDADKDIITKHGTTGSLINRLESSQSRLLDQEFSFTKLLSDVEDADLTKLVTDLAMQENSYQAALIATSKIIQPSLMDFLR